MFHGLKSSSIRPQTKKTTMMMTMLMLLRVLSCWAILFVVISIHIPSSQAYHVTRYTAGPSSWSLLPPSRRRTVVLSLSSSTSSSYGGPPPRTPDSRPPSRITFNKRTLYEILGAAPTETRAELKRRYVQLARISHPDAVRNQNNDNSDIDNSSTSPDFTEIAAAWRILSDAKERKRYDRSLQAEEFAENVGIWANDLAKQAAPMAQWAMPFIRRTTATTLAGVTAAAQTVAPAVNVGNRSSSTTVNNGTGGTTTKLTTSNKRQQQQPADLSRAFATAMDAARRAGRYVDSLELVEKSQELEKRAWTEQEQAERFKLELQQIVDRRLTMALRTPGSGLTSAEATVILQDYNQTIVNIAGPASSSHNDTVSISSTPTIGSVGSGWSPFGRRKQETHVSIQVEIERLEQIEQSFIETQVADTQAQSAYQESVQQQLLCIRQMRQAEMAEQQARRAWELTQEAVDNAKLALEETSRTLTQAKVESKKSDYEMERQSISLAQQSEKVRTALREKEKVVRETRRKAAETGWASYLPKSTTTTTTLTNGKEATFNGGPTAAYHQSITNSVTRQQQQGIRYQYNLQEEEFLAAIPEEESPERFQELSELRAEERLLAETSASLEEMASNLLEQATQMRKRAEELERPLA